MVGPRVITLVGFHCTIKVLCRNNHNSFYFERQIATFFVYFVKFVSVKLCQHDLQWFIFLINSDFSPSLFCCNTDSVKAILNSAVVNFIKFLCALFSYKSAPCSFSLITSWLCEFLVKGYWKKSWSKMLMKLTPFVNYINVLCTNVMYESLFSSFFYLHVTWEKLPKRRLYAKARA